MLDDRPVGGGEDIDFGIEVDEDFSNYSVESLLLHKNWKARRRGYEAVTQNPQRYKGDVLINAKNICRENNACGLECLLRAFCCIVSHCDSDELDLLCSTPLALSIEKGITGRPSAERGAVNFIISLVEAGKDVFGPLLSAFTHRTPKNRLAAVHVCGELVNNFGVAHFPLKRIMKAVIPLFSDANSLIRKEAASLCCEVYAHIGESIKAYLTDIREAQMNELDRQFEQVIVSAKKPLKKIDGKEAVPQGSPPVSAQERAGDCTDQRFMELYESPVLSRLPKDFFMKALNKSAAWQDRCALVNEILLPLLSQPRLKQDNYHELASFMREYLMDPQAPPMLLGFKMIQECARGLRSGFQPHARGYLHPLFEKMKDKKTSIQDHVSLTLEKIISFHCVSLDQCLDEMELVTTSKNPTQRLALINFCIRIIGKLPPNEIGKFSTAYTLLNRMVHDEKLENRENGYRLIALLASIFGVETYESVLRTMEEKQKARFYTFFSQIRGEQYKAKTPTNSPAKKVIRVEEARRGSSPSSSEAMDSDCGPHRSPVVRESQPFRVPPSHNRPLGNIVNPDDGVSLEATLPKKDVAVQTILGLSNGDTSILDLLRSKEWDRRCEGAEKVRALVSSWSPGDCTKYFNILLVYFRFAPSLKESTYQVFQVMRTALYDAMSRAAMISQGAGYVLVTEYTPRLTEPKNRTAVRDTCFFIGDRFGPRFVARHMIAVATQIHTPKLLQEVNEFLCELIALHPADNESSAPLDIGYIVDYIRAPCLNQLLPAVRMSAVHLLVALRRHSGPCVDEHVESLPPAVQHMYDQEFEGEVRMPSLPPKTTSPSKRLRSNSQTESAHGEQKPSSRSGVSDGFDIVKAAMKSVSTESDWRKRLDGVKRIEEQLSLMRGETLLPPLLTEHLMKVLSSRFTESNKNFVVDVLRVIPLVVQTSEPLPSRSALLKWVMPSALCMLGDQKSNLREEARNVCTIGMKIAGLESLLQSLAKPLNADSNACRQGVLELMVLGFSSLPRGAALPKLRLSQLVPGVVNAMMDRISEVRALAELVVGYMMQYIGDEPFNRHIQELKPAEQNIVVPIVERQAELNHPAVEGHLNSTVNTEQDEVHSRTASERFFGSTARETGSARKALATATSRRPASRPQKQSADSSLQMQDSHTYSRSATSEMGLTFSGVAPVSSSSRGEGIFVSIHDIVNGIRTADVPTASQMCASFLKQSESGADYGSSEMIQAMVDRLAHSTALLEDSVPQQLCQCLSHIFSHSQCTRKCENSFLFHILGILFDCLLSEQFTRNPMLIKALNTMVLKLLEGCHADEVFSALLSRLTSYSTTYLQTGRKEDLKFVQVTVKCIMRHNIQNVSPENVVLCSHEYLLQHPPSTFRAVDDLPVRTVKTILQTLARQYGKPLLPMATRLIGPENLVTHFIRACLETKEKAEENERQAREESAQQTRASMRSNTPSKRVSPLRSQPAPSVSSAHRHADPAAEVDTGSRLESSPRRDPAPAGSTAGNPDRLNTSLSSELVPPQPSSSAPSFVSSSQHMAQIFNKIRNYQSSGEGIEELYALLRVHAADAAEGEVATEFNRHFHRCSEPFRLFIKRKLEAKMSTEPAAFVFTLPAAITGISS